MIPAIVAALYYLLPFRRKLSEFNATKNDSVLTELVSQFLGLQMMYNPYLAKYMFTPGKICVFKFESIDSMAASFEDSIKNHRTARDFFIKDRTQLEVKLGEWTNNHPSLYGHVGVYFPYTSEDGFVSGLIEDVYNDNSILACHFCNFKFKNLKTCSGCGIAQYCSPEHQKTHWKVHKYHCKRLIQEVD